MKKEKKTIPCPHCKMPVSPASLLGKMSAEKRKLSTKDAVAMNKARWGK